MVSPRITGRVELSSVVSDLNRMMMEKCASAFAAVMAIFGHAAVSQAQDDSDYLPGKVYVVRMSAFVADDDSLMSVVLPRIGEQLSAVGEMMAYIKQNTYVMHSAADRGSFVGYFHADRQQKEQLMRDFYQLVWLFHGHDVQIMPLELVRPFALHVAPALNDGLATPAR